MHAIDRITLSDIANDANGVSCRGRNHRRQVQAFDIIRSRARKARQPAKIFRTTGVDAGQVGSKRPRHHQPFRMAECDMVAGRRQIEPRNQVDVDPGVNLETRLVRAGNRQRQRIKRRLRCERCGMRLDASLKIGIAATADLNQQRIETARLGGSHHRGDGGRRRQRRPNDPQRADFLFGGECGRRERAPENAQHRQRHRRSAHDCTEHECSRE
jgi:hypothetical protein